MKKIVLMVTLLLSMATKNFAISNSTIADGLTVLFTWEFGPVGCAAAATVASMGFAIAPGGSGGDHNPLPFDPNPIFYPEFSAIGEMHNASCIGILRNKKGLDNLPVTVSAYFSTTYKFKISKDELAKTNDIVKKAVESNNYSQVCNVFRNPEIRGIAINFWQGLKKIEKEGLANYIAQTKQKLDNVKGENVNDMNRLKASITVLQYSNALWRN
jgi:hypothetical protein